MAVEARLRSMITQFALQHFDVTLEEVLSSTQKRHVSHARALIVWLARTCRPDTSFELLGAWLGHSERGAAYMYRKGHRLQAECPHFQRGCDDFAALYRTTMEVPYACA